MFVAVAAVVGVCGYAATRWSVAVLSNSSRGLDVSDESFYLVSVMHPRAASGVVTEFGFYLRPLMALCAGSLARFRAAGVVLIWLVAALVATLAIPSSWGARRTRSVARAVATLIVGAVALTTYVMWLTTPGYNLLVLLETMVVAGLAGSLVLQACRLAEGAAADQPSNGDRREARTVTALVALLVPGAGTKGPAFAAVGVLALVVVVLASSVRRLPLRVVAGALIGLLVHLAFVGSPFADARRLSRGLHAYRLLNAYSTASVWETSALRSNYGPWMLRLFAGALVLVLVWRRERRPFARLAITGVGAIASVGWLLRCAPSGGGQTFPSNAGWWWVRLTAVTLLWLTANAPRPTRLLAGGPVVALMAVGATVGTNNGFVRQVSLTAGVLAVGVLVQAVIVVGPPGPRDRAIGESLERALRSVPLFAFFLVAGIVSARLLDDAVATPYRLGGPLRTSMVPVHLDRLGTVRVVADTASYVTALQALRAAIPDDARDCLVDLSGGTPLSALALGMRPAGYQWILGAYPGSNAMAAALLSGVRCLEGSFVLIEAPGGERAVARPSRFRTDGAVLLGTVRFDGYLHETQQVWLVGASR